MQHIVTKCLQKNRRIFASQKAFLETKGNQYNGSLTIDRSRLNLSVEVDKIDRESLMTSQTLFFSGLKCVLRWEEMSWTIPGTYFGSVYEMHADPNWPKESQSVQVAIYNSAHPIDWNLALEMQSVELSSASVTNCVTVIYQGTAFRILGDEQSNATVIFCDSPMASDSFLAAINRISLIFGWINGAWIQNSVCIYNSNAQFVSYYRLPDTVKTKFKPVLLPGQLTTHKFRIDSNERFIKVSTVVLSNLVDLISNDDLHRVVYLLVELSILSAETGPIVMSAALEILVQYAKAELTLDYGDMKSSKKILKDLREKIIQIISEDTIILEDEKIKAIARTGNLFGLSNQDKILTTLEACGLNLNDRDIESVKARNNYLHGKFNALTPGKGNDNVRHMTRISSLLSEAILRLAGYEGLIVNWDPLLYRGAFIVDEEGYRSNGTAPKIYSN